MSDAPEYFRCENGHAVRAGSTLCTECGAAVTTRRARAPKEPAAVAVSLDAEYPATADAARTATGVSRVPMRVITAIAIAGVIAVAGIGFAIFAIAGGGGRQGGDIPGGGSGFITACDGAAKQEITIGENVTTSYDLLCFVLEESATVRIGASPRGSDADLTLTVLDANGTRLADNDDTYGHDPEVVVDVTPGTYLVVVAEYAGPLNTAVDIVSSSTPLDSPGSALPTLADCGSLEVDVFIDSDTQARSANQTYTCIALSSGAFVKVGAQATDPSVDLTLALYLFDPEGDPTFVRSTDDTFGTDPELSLNLEPGLYLAEVLPYGGGVMGDYTLYVDTDGTFFREGDPSTQFSQVTEADCADAPALSLGVAVPFGSGDPIGCLTLADPLRVVVHAESLASQDLTVEVIRVDGDEPQRYAWGDEDVFGVDLASQDPRIEVTLPAGNYVIGVGEYWNSEDAHDFVLTVSRGDAYSVG